MRKIWSAAALAGIVGIGAMTALRDPADLQAAVRSERAAIESLCYNWAIAQSDKGQYDNHTGARIEGCRAAYLEASLVRDVAPEGQRLVRVIELSNQGHNESAYYVEQVRLTLHGAKVN